MCNSLLNGCVSKISSYAFLLKALHVVGDGLIEYRVRELIVNGIFEIKGVLKAMRFYRGKFRSPQIPPFGKYIEYHSILNVY
ncbi:DUF3658 domain-containing protein [Bacillus sp. S/N-304-OC-R1]|uniref:DUF3658 domain-containing protein n=1 Tax=Bacillus sp. S/N-304-OC-R1 TaxID=2758034 RepID=UPI0028BF1887|nr:DUF3658 domain-containing protein [Bacillus sp. S/N-304-OC-R1]